MKPPPAFRAAAMLSLLLLAAWATAQGPGRSGPGQNRTTKDLAVGDRAPDFELPRLDPFLKGEATSQTQLQLVRLSALCVRHPVVLLFSSYT